MGVPYRRHRHQERSYFEIICWHRAIDSAEFTLTGLNTTRRMSFRTRLSVRWRLARDLHFTMTATPLAPEGAVGICADQEGLKDAAKAFGAGTGRDTPTWRDIARMIASDGGFAPHIQTILSSAEYLQPQKLAIKDAHGRQS
jgi:hypothetical protein